MTRAIRDNKTIFELQEEADYEWRDGDDGALYDAGYEDGINHAIGILDSVLAQDRVDSIPASWLIKVIKHTLQGRE